MYNFKVKLRFTYFNVVIIVNVFVRVIVNGDVNGDINAVVSLLSSSTSLLHCHNYSR